jgi:hypothetical protein
VQWFRSSLRISTGGRFGLPMWPSVDLGAEPLTSLDQFLKAASRCGPSEH